MSDSTKTPAKLSTPATSKMPVVPWNPLWAVVFLSLLYFAAQLVGGLAVSAYASLRGWNATQTHDWLNDSVYAQFSFVLIVEALTIAAIYLFVRRYKLSMAVIGLKKPRLKDVGVGVLVYPVYFIVFAVFLTLATLIPSFDPNQTQETGFNGTHGFLPLIVAFISLVILPPLTEEIMIRGLLFGSLRKYIKFGGAALITSLIFASLHLPEGGAAGPLYIAAIDTFILSIALCYLREKTGSLWAGITLHALKNLVAYFSLFILHH